MPVENPQEMQHLLQAALIILGLFLLGGLLYWGWSKSMESPEAEQAEAERLLKENSASHNLEGVSFSQAVLHDWDSNHPSQS